MKTSLALAPTLLLLLAPAAFAQSPASVTEEATTSSAALPRVVDPAPPEVETISVFGRRMDANRIAGSAHSIPTEELERFEYDDVGRVLSRVPGVYFRDEDGFGLRPNIGLRGASSDRSAKVTLLEDGILLAPAPYSAPAAYYFPQTTRMAGVEVFKGPAGIQHGPNTIGGAVNMRTARPPTGLQGTADIAAGQFDYFKGHGRLGYGDDRFGVLIEGVHLHSSGFKELGDDEDTGFNKNEVMAKLRYNTDPADDVLHRFEVKLGYSDERSNETYLGISDEDFAENSVQRYLGSQLGRMAWDRTMIHATYSLSAGDSFDASLTYYRHDYDRVWDRLNNFRDGTLLYEVVQAPQGVNQVYVSVLRGETDSAPDQDLVMTANAREFLSEGLQFTSNLRGYFLDMEHSLTLGIRFHRDEILRNHTETTFLMRTGEMIRDNTPVRQARLETGSAEAIAAYVQEELTLFNQLVLTPGLRFEWIRTRLENEVAPDGPTVDVATNTIFVPGMGALWRIDDQFSVLAGVHRGFSPVPPGQPEETQPETSINYEAGARFRRNESMAEVVGFMNDYQNLTAVCTFSSGCSEDQLAQQFDAGDAIVYGFEATAGHTFQLWSTLALELRGAYTWTRSRFSSDFSSPNPLWGDVSEGDELPYLPEHLLNASVGISSPGYGAFVSYTYGSPMRDVAGQGDVPATQKTDPQHVVDLVVQYEVIEGAKLYFRVDNLLDQRYIAARRPFGARPGKPLQVVGGLTYRFGP